MSSDPFPKMTSKVDARLVRSKCSGLLFASINHHPLATEQSIISFLQAHRSLARGLSLLLPFHLHYSLTHDGCRQGKMCVEVQVSFCHGIVCREHVFWQVLPLGAEEYAQENLTGAFLHSGQEARCWSW